MRVGQTVTGKYCGDHAISGIVQSVRPLTVKTDACEIIVALDIPITVYGTERASVVCHTQWDGSPSAYNKFGDQLNAKGG